MHTHYEKHYEKSFTDKNNKKTKINHQQYSKGHLPPVDVALVTSEEALSGLVQCHSPFAERLNAY